MNFGHIATSLMQALNTVDNAVQRTSTYGENSIASAAHSFLPPSTSCSQQGRYLPPNQHPDCFLPDDSIAYEFGVAVEYARQDPTIDAKIQELCQELKEHHGGYRLPIHNHPQINFILDAPTNMQGHDARIYWNPNKKTVYRLPDGTVSNKSVSPAAELFGPLISSAHSAFANPKGYRYSLMMYHPDYQTIEQARVGKEMNETQHHLPEGAWSTDPFHEGLHAQCVIDSDGLPHEPITGKAPLAQFFAQLHREQCAQSSFHHHLVPLSRVRPPMPWEHHIPDDLSKGLLFHTNELLEQFNFIMNTPGYLLKQISQSYNGKSSSLKKVAEQTRTDFIQKNAPHDSLLRNAEDIRTTVIMGKAPDLKMVKEYEQKALRKIQAMARSASPEPAHHPIIPRVA